MKRSAALSLFLFLSVFTVHFTPATSLYFLVTQGVKRCFLEEVPAHTVVVGVYQIQK